MWVPSPLRNRATKSRNRNSIVTNSVKAFKSFHILKSGFLHNPSRIRPPVRSRCAFRAGVLASREGGLQREAGLHPRPAPVFAVCPRPCSPRSGGAVPSRVTGRLVRPQVVSSGKGEQVRNRVPPSLLNAGLSMRSAKLCALEQSSEDADA